MTNPRLAICARRLALLLIGLAFAPANAADSLIQEYEGNGASNTRPFTVASSWEVQWNSSGDIFQLYLHDSNGNLVDIVANQMGTGNGASYRPEAGTYYLQVNAIGRWTVQIVQVDDTPARVGGQPIAFSGNGAVSTRPFASNTPWEVQWDTASDIFQLYLYDGNGNLIDIVANQMGAGTGASYQPKVGTFYLQINAIGAWSLQIIRVD